MKPTFFLLLLPILFTSPAYAWVVSADFEDGVVGTTALSNTDGFHDAAGDSQYASSPALSGSNSASVNATGGQTGFGDLGGIIRYPAISEGDELWFRVNVYYPAGWSFSCGGCTEGMKFMRLNTRTSANGSSQGYHDALINDRGAGGLIWLGSEVDGAGFPYDTARRIGTPAQFDQWIAYEMYVKYSADPAQGVRRFWKDGVLISEITNIRTLRSASDISNAAYLYTYWNNGAPKTQTSYIDDIIITNVIPSRQDAAGNPYVGVGASIYIAPPNAPVQINVE